MQFEDLPIGTPSLEDAIDRHPLIVAPEMPLLEAIALMNRTRVHCPTRESTANSDRIPLTEARSSCALVMVADELFGIFTERDIVRLTAAGVNFAQMSVSHVMANPVVTLKQTEFQNVFAALFLFRRYRMRHLVIVGDRDRLVGVVSSESIRRVLRPANLLKMRRVAEVMTTPVIQAALSASVMSVAELMARHRVSCVAIIATDAEPFALPVGIITERDIVQFQALELDLSQTPAEAVMSSPLCLLSPEDSLWTAHQEMQKRRVRRLVVSWDWGRGLGIVTQTSLLRIFDPVEMYGVVETLQRTVDELEGQPKPASPALDTSGQSEDYLALVRDCLERLGRRSNLSPQQQDAIVAQGLAALAQLEKGMGR
ncbi:MAG: CBS domain-containing protein [Cyanobacteriota bacterium]|nr:CBS domain-containing protein [Cyanobacteriota bacterium]